MNAPLVVVVLQTILAILGIIFFITNYGWVSWSRFWTSPLLLLTASLFMLYVSGKSSYLPISIMRAQGFFFGVMAWPTAGLLVLQNYRIQIVNTSTYEIGMVVAYVSVLISSYPGLKLTRRAFNISKHLSTLRDSVFGRLKSLEALSGYLGEAQFLKMLHEPLSQANVAFNVASSCINDEKHQAAEAAFIHAEMELDYVERVVKDRIELSLKDELNAMLILAGQETEELVAELKSAQLNSEIINPIKEQIKTQKIEVNTLPQKTYELLDWLRPFKEIQTSLVDTRTALRFYLNSGDSLRRIEQMLFEQNNIEHLCEVLGFSVQTATDCRITIEEELNTFKSGKFSNFGSLVVGYQTIQNKMQDYIRILSNLKNVISQNWQVFQFPESEILIYVPRACRTGEDVLGAVFYNNKESLSLSIVFDSPSLELPSNSTIDCDGLQIDVLPFIFAARREGKATLSASVFKNDQKVTTKSTRIRVFPSLIELAKNAAFFIPIMAGIGTFCFWLNGMTLKDAAQLGSVSGAIIVVITVIIIHIIIRRKYKFSSGNGPL